MLNLSLIQIAWDQAQRLAKRRIEREEGHKDVTEDMIDFFPGEKSDYSLAAESTTTSGKGRMPRVSSVDRVAEWAKQPKEKKLYIVLIRYVGFDALRIKNIISSKESFLLCICCIICSLHGLVRGDDMELGRDSDTGGQVRFVCAK